MYSITNQKPTSSNRWRKQVFLDRKSV